MSQSKQPGLENAAAPETDVGHDVPTAPIFDKLKKITAEMLAAARNTIPGGEPGSSITTSFISKEIELGTNPRSVEAFAEFQKAIGADIKVVYYPACATDITPALALPDSRVIFVDIDDKALAAVAKAGYETHTISAFEYIPDQPVDALILRNPSLSPDWFIQYVKSGGYIVCNDWHETATQLRTNPEVEFIGQMNEDENKHMFLDTANLDDFFEKVPFEWKGVSLSKNKKGHMDNLFIFRKK